MVIESGQTVMLWPDDAPDMVVIPAAERPSLRVYPAPGDPAPTVVVLPGGGYGFVSPLEAEPVARWLNGEGFTAITVTYRMAPHRSPAPLQDAVRAIRLARAAADEWGVIPSRLGLMGFSAGGHLAASVATLGADVAFLEETDLSGVIARPEALVLGYPVITMHPPHAHEGSVANLLGDPAADADRERWSLETRVTADTPPTFLWHTAEDEPVPVENSLLVAERLAHHGVPFALHVFPHGRHGLELAVDEPLASAWTGLCADWLRATLA